MLRGRGASRPVSVSGVTPPTGRFNRHLTRKLGILSSQTSIGGHFLVPFFFGLSAEPEDEEQVRFAPTFRSLFSYFARRHNGGGMLVPIQQSSKQQPWDQQVAVSYLLGLDARISQEFQEVRTQEKAMTELRKAAKEGGLGRYFGTAGELRTRLTIAEARARRLYDQVANFNVVQR